MDAKSYLGMFIGVFILVTVVAATGGTLLTNIVALNTTFQDTVTISTC